MDWWKLFGGTFILIFLAELGDKTQLAALAKTADSPDSPTAKWVVFLAASAALALSTFIAVFLGHLLQKIIPDQRYIRVASAVLFLIFGGLILYDVFRARPDEVTEIKDSAPSTTVSGRQPGYIGQLALIGAMEFEAFAADRYRQMAKKATDPHLAQLLTALASEEDRHLTRLQNLPAPGLEKESGTRVPVNPGDLDAATSRREALATLISHEDATADFYQDLAARATLPGLRDTFTQLADEEKSHAARLRAWVEEVVS